jgi:hypothetical protein
MTTTATARQEKERLYIRKSNELQRIWKNPIDPHYDDHKAVRELSDERLDELLHETVGQIRFEKILGAIKIVFLSALGIFVGLGVIGLLIFGIKQLLIVV